MAERTVTTYICDGCGLESTDKGFNNGSECGASTVRIDGHKGGKSYDGSWGGVGIARDLLLCFSCVDHVLSAIDVLSKP